MMGFLSLAIAEIWAAVETYQITHENCYYQGGGGTRIPDMGWEGGVWGPEKKCLTPGKMARKGNWAPKLGARWLASTCCLAAKVDNNSRVQTGFMDALSPSLTLTLIAILVLFLVDTLPLLVTPLPTLGLRAITIPHGSDGSVVRSPSGHCSHPYQALIIVHERRSLLSFF
jgi:hypothetical protein